ncbi:MAG: flagellar biosynthesis protein FlgE [Gammaproteobacteria bacterium]
MSTIPTLNIGLLGMQRAMNDAQRNAGKIAAAVRNETQRPVELATPMVGLMLDRQQAQASAQVIKTADEMIGTIIDIMA